MKQQLNGNVTLKSWHLILGLVLLIMTITGSFSGLVLALDQIDENKDNYETIEPIVRSNEMGFTELSTTLGFVLKNQEEMKDGIEALRNGRN